MLKAYYGACLWIRLVQGFCCYCSVDPRDGHPLVLVGEDLQRLNHFAECGVRIFVDDYLVEIFLVRALDSGTLFQCVLEILLLRIRQMISY